MPKQRKVKMSCTPQLATVTVVESATVFFPPTREDAAVNQLFEQALPCPECRAGQHELWPVISTDLKVYAVLCSCDYIGDSGTTIAEAITAWNNDAQRPRRA